MVANAEEAQMSVVERLAELGIELPEPLPIHGRYRAVVVRGDLAFTSGALATTGPPLRIAWPGQLGADVSIEEGKESARGALVATLSNLASALGDLDRVEGFLHLRGHVNAVPGFDKVHHVVGAANDLIGELFGPDGLAARTAIGVATLPENASVVLDAVVAIRT
jgi:enamine deaminase RidA (YjgF/YER057c/UK114 family)